MSEMETVVEHKKQQVNILIDASTMSAFEKCPTLMKLQYVDHYVSKAGKSKALDKGDLLHVPLKHYYRQKQLGVEWEKAVEIARDKLIKYSSKLINLPATDIEDVMVAFLSYTEHYRFERWTILETERPFRIIIFEDADIRIIFQGKIDLMVDTGQVIIPVDHKSESRRTEAIPLSEQFMGYTFAARANNLLVNKIGFQSSLKPEDKFYRTLLSYDDDNLLEWRDEFVFKVRELLGYAEIDYFPHRYTSCQDKYGKCMFHDICHTPRVARQYKLDSQFEIATEPWDPFKDLEEEDKD